MDPGVPWIELIRDLICKLYQEWGGDCADLGTVPTAWIDSVENEYQQNGAPEFENDAERQACLANLTQLENALASSANSLSPADNARLTTLIDNLQNDIQGAGA